MPSTKALVIVFAVLFVYLLADFLWFARRGKITVWLEPLNEWDIERS